MNKTIFAGLAILVLVVGMGSTMMNHSAEAKGMPQHWLNSDGKVKQQYLPILRGTTSPDAKFPLVHSSWAKTHNP
ncbi:MAG: hypothetical protein D4R90_00015 [Nitrosopumilales archaeon]|nr:MAG: hypothetical protein D4R90_00015 [Nitrosopumilales archaeon]